MKISRRTKAMVTGAASGIGRCVALALAANGADLWLTDIDRENLDLTAQQAKALGVEVVTTVCDLRSGDEIDALAAACVTVWGRLNILVNCAGLTHFGSTSSASHEDWQRVMDINLAAPIRLTRALLPTLVAQDQAHIVNLCSIFGLTTMPNIAAYQTSKFALVGFSLALDAEYGRKGFGVTALCPGIVRTPMIAKLSADMADRAVAIPSWTGTTPEKIATRAIRAIRRNDGLVVITPTARLYWAVMRISPGFVRWFHRLGVFAFMFILPVRKARSMRG